MADAGLITGVRDELRGLMDDVVGEARRLQPAPVGQRERSPAELRALWETIKGLPGDVSGSIINQMSAKSGHKDGEQVPCEACKFVADMTLGDLGIKR